MYGIINTVLHAEVVEWQTQQTQNPLNIFSLSRFPVYHDFSDIPVISTF